MPLSFFVSDLHGSLSRYEALFRAIRQESPEAVFIGGDLMPLPSLSTRSLPDKAATDFLHGFLARKLKDLRKDMGQAYPAIFVIMGNGDLRFMESSFYDLAADGLWHMVHGRHVTWQNWTVMGYSYVPPSPLKLKDWERFDMACYTDPGCTPPTEGLRSLPVPRFEQECATIDHDLRQMAGSRDLSRTICLFHTPPYQSALDRAALDGREIDYVPLNVHVGSVAVKRFIERHQPLITLHGHIHESARITDRWRESLGRTLMMSAAHDGSALSLIRFDPHTPGHAERQLIEEPS